jgi:hypothetical protein
MRSIIKLLAVLGFAGALFSTVPASAQISRTWVSSTGTDAGACGRANPCRSLIFAMTRTLAGGQISCVDGASFGPIIILKSLTIECDASPGGIIVDNGNAVTILTQDTDVVHIRGLQIAGMPTSCCGIRVAGGGTIILEHVVVRNFAGDYGLVVEAAGTARVFVSDSSFSNNGTGGIGGGILIQPTGTGTASVLLNHVEVQGNNGAGIRVKTTSSTGTGNYLEVRNSQISGNTYGVIMTAPAGFPAAFASVQDSAMTRNTNYGLAVSGALAQMAVSGSSIMGNANGVLAAGGGTMVSGGDNSLLGNGANGFFSSVLPKQ